MVPGAREWKRHWAGAREWLVYSLPGDVDKSGTELLYRKRPPTQTNKRPHHELPVYLAWSRAIKGAVQIHRSSFLRRDLTSIVPFAWTREIHTKFFHIFLQLQPRFIPDVTFLCLIVKNIRNHFRLCFFPCVSCFFLLREFSIHKWDWPSCRCVRATSWTRWARRGRCGGSWAPPRATAAVVVAGRRTTRNASTFVLSWWAPVSEELLL